MANPVFNIVRKHNGNVEIFRRNLSQKEAVIQIKHWKKMARNSGGHVYFDMVEVPYELTPEGMAEAEKKRLAQAARSDLDQLITDAA